MRIFNFTCGKKLPLRIMKREEPVTGLKQNPIHGTDTVSIMKNVKEM
jgi:hypothetical protein